MILLFGLTFRFWLWGSVRSGSCGSELRYLGTQVPRGTTLSNLELCSGLNTVMEVQNHHQPLPPPPTKPPPTKPPPPTSPPSIKTPPPNKYYEINVMHHRVKKRRIINPEGKTFKCTTEDNLKYIQRKETEMHSHLLLIQMHARGTI